MLYFLLWLSCGAVGSPPAQRTFWFFSHIYVRALFPKIGIPHGIQVTIYVICVEFQELSNPYFNFCRVGQYDFFPPKLHSGPFPKKKTIFKSYSRFYCIFKNYTRRALWTYTVCHTNIVRCQSCANQVVKMRRFDPQTSLFRSNTPPTSSDGADHWCNLQLCAWAFQACVGSHVKILPKSRYDRDGAETRWFDLSTWLNRHEEYNFSESLAPT